MELMKNNQFARPKRSNCGKNPGYSALSSESRLKLVHYMVMYLYYPPLTYSGGGVYKISFSM